MSFPAARWADAYLAAAADDAQTGLLVLRSLEAAVAGKPLYISGEKRARDIMACLDRTFAVSGERTQGMRAAAAVLCLLAARGYTAFLSRFIRAIETEMDRRNGVVAARLESAAAPDDAFLEGLDGVLKRNYGALLTRISVAVNPDLIGGFRLTVGSERQDFSLRGRLARLGTRLGG